MRIYSFTGPIGSGKDTCADILKEEGITQGKISFAGPMKKMVGEICNIPLSTFEDRVLKEAPLARPVNINDYFLSQLFGYMDEYVSFGSEDTMLRAMDKMSYQMNHLCPTPRSILQYVGTKIIRECVDAHWHVKAAFSKKNLEGMDPEGTYSVTDARFANEYQWLQNRFMLDFSGFYVERPEAEVKLALATVESEVAVIETRKLIKPYYVLNNSGTIEDLKNQILRKV